MKEMDDIHISYFMKEMDDIYIKSIWPQNSVFRTMINNPKRKSFLIQCGKWTFQDYLRRLFYPDHDEDLLRRGPWSPKIATSEVYFWSCHDQQLHIYK